MWIDQHNMQKYTQQTNSDMREEMNWFVPYLPSL